MTNEEKPPEGDAKPPADPNDLLGRMTPPGPPQGWDGETDLNDDPTADRILDEVLNAPDPEPPTFASRVAAVLRRIRHPRG